MKTLVYLLVIGLVLGLAIPAFAAERNILKEGILGAATGAVAADQSDGKAGKGALIGVGTQVIGGALLDVVMPDQEESGVPKSTSREPVESATAQEWFTKGYQDGFKAGYAEGLKAAK